MDPKPWIESRTLIANAIVAVLAALGALAAVPFIAGYPPAVYVITGAIAVLNIALRIVTSQPLGPAISPPLEPPTL